MSTRGALTVVGQVVGAYVTGGSPYGAAIGSYIGSQIGLAIEGPQQVVGPRLGDLKVSGASYGTPIAYVEGHPRVAGTVIWASDKREIATTTAVGGKGGTEAEQTTYTYEIDLLVMVSANVIAGIPRVWSNSKLVYSTSTASDAASLIASQTAAPWAEMIVYTGGASQLPDPTYEAAVGAGNAPAYRGRGTVLIRGLQLGGSGQLPNLTFEVATSVTAADTTATIATDSSPWDAAFGPVVPDAAGATVHLGQWSNVSDSTSVLIKRYGLDGSVQHVGAYQVSTATLSTQPNIPHGNADVPCLLMHRAVADANTVYDLYDEQGLLHLSVDLGDNLGPYACRYSYRGGVLVLAGGGGGSFSTSKKIYKLESGVLTSSSAMGSYVKCVVLAAAAIYALVDASSLSIYQINRSTLALDATLTAPGLATENSVLLVDDDGALCYANATTLYRWNGASWVTVAATLGNAGPVQQGLVRLNVNAYALTGNSLVAYEATSTTARALYYNLPTITSANETLDAVVSRLCLRAGLTAPQFNVTALAGIVVRAFPIGQVTSTRAALEVLMGAYAFEAVESGGVLKFVLRGGASAATLPYAEMGATTGNADEPLPILRRNDLEAPAQVVLRYINDSDDYQDGSEASDRLVSSGEGVQMIDVPVCLTPAEAKALADKTIMDIAAASMSFGPVGLTRDYAALEPTDVVTLTDLDGTTYRARIVKQAETAGVKRIECVLDDASVLSSVVGTTTSGYTTSISVAAPAETVMELMDIPILRDADNDPGLYAAFKGRSTPWPGAVLFGGIDGLSYTQRDSVAESTAIGTCTTTLGNYTGTNKFDWANSVTVDVGAATLSSDTYENLLTLETNAALIGNNEIIQFMTATLVSTGVYTLTGLLRGRRGTEWAMTGHAAGERFVLLQPAGLRRVAQSTSEIGSLRHYKGVTIGRALGTASDQTITNAAVGLKPYAPVDLRGSRDASSNLTITWSRRTRLAKNFTNGTVPLGEASESYQVDVFSSNTYTTLKRTISVTGASASYTAAEQTTDFGSTQATVYVRVYQISATVGRGTKLEGGV